MARSASGPADTWTDLDLNDRCMLWSAGPPMLPAGYNDYYLILQTPDHVAIHVEMIHDTRIIPAVAGRGCAALGGRHAGGPRHAHHSRSGWARCAALGGRHAWSGELPLRRTDETLFEYACHEGNYGIVNMLSGARAQERQVAGDEGASR